MAKKKSADAPRLFEFSDGKSDKFWEISMSGTSHTVRYGRIGTDGQTKTKDFADVAATEKSYQKLIDQKVKKGYAEKGSESRSAKAQEFKSALKEHEPFLKAIAAAPDDYEPYGVFADWLTEQGDPRGEFIQLQWQLEDPKCKGPTRKKITAAEKKLLKTHRLDWLGDLREEAEREVERNKALKPMNMEEKPFEAGFARGFVDSIKISYLWPEFATLLTKSKSVELLRKLHVEMVPNAYELMEEYPQYEDKNFAEHCVAKALAKAKFPNLRELRIAEEYPCHVSTPGIHKLIKNSPLLETLHLESHDVSAPQLFKTPMPNLKHLAVYHIHQHPIKVLGKNASLTNLETLEFKPHGLEYDAEPYIALPELKAITGSKYLKNLKHLVLIGTDFGNAGIKELIKSGMLAQLESLDLEYGAVTDEGAAMLLELEDFGNLKRLNLKGNYITPKVATSLKKLKGIAIDASDPIGTEPSSEEPEHLWMGDPE